MSDDKPDTSPKLTDDAKTYVVLRLAAYDSPSSVLKGLKEEFGVVIARQSIEYYDPTSVAGRDLADQWKTLFLETRAKIVEGKADVGAANKMVRVRWRADMARRAMDTGNFVLANEILDAIAKEMGESFTNKQKHEHSGTVRVEGTDAELDDRIAELEAKLGVPPAAPSGTGAAQGREGTPALPQQAQDALSGGGPASA